VPGACRQSCPDQGVSAINRSQIGQLPPGVIVATAGALAQLFKARARILN
jgi:hypothetical protein